MAQSSAQYTSPPGSAPISARHTASSTPYTSHTHTPAASTSTGVSTVPSFLSKRDSFRPPSGPSYPSSLQQQLFGPPSTAPSQHVSILDRPLNKTRGAEVALPAFAFLLSEMVSYSQSRVDSVTDLERRLSSLGYEVGLRVLGLLQLRNTQTTGGKVSTLLGDCYETHHPRIRNASTA